MRADELLTSAEERFQRCDARAQQRDLGLLDACAVGAQWDSSGLDHAGRAATGRTLLSQSPISPNAGFKRPWGWPYSGPRAAGVSGVNAGESVGPCRRSCWARQQVRGPIVLASKCRSGTLTRKRSLVQIQYGPPDFRTLVRFLRLPASVPGRTAGRRSCRSGVGTSPGARRELWACATGMLGL
jgi:hypothetical protein